MKTLSNTKFRFGTWMFLLLMGVAISFSACGNDDDDTYLPPNPEIVKALNKLYPTAQNIEWSQKGVYYVADCYSQGQELDVWFDANANWLQTEVALFRDDLPASVNTAFAEGEYADWVIDDITLIMYPQELPQYVLEVQQGAQERELFYSEDGNLLHVKDITNADDTHWPTV